MTELTFEEMERQIREMLGRALADGGFDPARDIEAITCNRWSHGYAYEYMVVGRVLAGRRTADREGAPALGPHRDRERRLRRAFAYCRSAIDQAANCWGIPAICRPSPTFRDRRAT